MKIDTIIKAAGGVGVLAAKCGVTHTSVIDWRNAGYLPGPRVMQIARITKIPVETLIKLVRPPGVSPDNGRSARRKRAKAKALANGNRAPAAEAPEPVAIPIPVPEPADVPLPLEGGA